MKTSVMGGIKERVPRLFHIHRILTGTRSTDVTVINYACKNWIRAGCRADH